MNRIYKTVWNAVRGQLVVVNEATTSHSQADASTKTGSVVSQSAPVQTFAKTALAAVVAGMLVNPAFAADKTLQWEVDQSAGISAADNVTITETGGITRTTAAARRMKTPSSRPARRSPTRATSVVTPSSKLRRS